MSIRAALGARPGDLYRLVFGEGLLIVMGGVGAGVAGAWGLMRVLSTLLYDVHPHDPPAMLGAGCTGGCGDRGLLLARLPRDARGPHPGIAQQIARIPKRRFFVMNSFFAVLFSAGIL